MSTGPEAISACAAGNLSSLQAQPAQQKRRQGEYTREQSEVSALCEAVERYSGAFHGEEMRIRRRLVTDFGDR